MTGPRGVFLLAPVTEEALADWRHAVQLDRRPLSRRQEQIMAFIGHYIALNGYAPSFREIGRACGYAPSAVSAVRYQVGELVARGLLELPERAGQPRSLRLVRPGEVA